MAANCRRPRRRPLEARRAVEDALADHVHEGDHRLIGQLVDRIKAEVAAVDTVDIDGEQVRRDN